MKARLFHIFRITNDPSEQLASVRYCQTFQFFQCSWFSHDVTKKFKNKELQIPLGVYFHEVLEKLKLYTVFQFLLREVSSFCVRLPKRNISLDIFQVKNCSLGEGNCTFTFFHFPGPGLNIMVGCFFFPQFTGEWTYNRGGGGLIGGYIS